jgi:hypothetical protein
MSEPIVIKMPIKTVSEANLREHWAQKARRSRKQRQVAALLTHMAMRKFGFVVEGKLRITLTRIAPRKLDDDNNARAHKAVRDGIADALAIDDADERLEWVYAQQRGAVREYVVLVTIEEGGGCE